MKKILSLIVFALLAVGPIRPAPMPIPDPCVTFDENGQPVDAEVCVVVGGRLLCYCPL